MLSLATLTYLWLAVDLIANDCAPKRNSYQKTCGNTNRGAHQGQIWHAVRVPSSSTLSCRVTMLCARLLQICAEQIACRVTNQSAADSWCASVP